MIKGHVQVVEILYTFKEIQQKSTKQQNNIGFLLQKYCIKSLTVTDANI